MCLKTAPAFPTSMFTRPMTCRGTAAICCGADARHRRLCVHIEAGRAEVGSFLRTLVLGRLTLHTISSYEKLYSLNSLFLRAKQAVLVAKLVVWMSRALFWKHLALGFPFVFPYGLMDSLWQKPEPHFFIWSNGFLQEEEPQNLVFPNGFLMTYPMA